MEWQRNQSLVQAVPGIKVSVINAHRDSDNLAESAIIRTLPNGKEEVIGIQWHGRHGRDGTARRKTNRAIACQIARQIRKREAAKAKRLAAQEG